MKKFFLKGCVGILSATVFFSVRTFSPGGTVTVHAAETPKIHYLTLPGNTEAILLESNGRFGMVDSGEDNDYPDGSDPRYPKRDDIVIGNGYEDDVIAYLNSVGVTQDNFDFYIGTHVHSDHIGSADEVIRAFHPKRVYMQEYKDAYITSDYNLWDNLYVYDHLISTAKETGATIIQNFDPSLTMIYPERIAIEGTITWKNDTPEDRPASVTVTLEGNAGIQTTEVQPDAESGLWTYRFEDLYKYDNDKNPLDYQVKIELPEGYQETSSSDYDFILTSDSPSNQDSGTSSDADAEFNSSSPDTESASDQSSDTDSSEDAASELPKEEGGVRDDTNTEDQTAVSDGTHTDAIPDSDRVDPTDPLDPNNKPDTGSSDPGQIGIHDDLSDTLNTTSTPIFTLGSDMQIEIVHYGYNTEPKPDDNYHSLGVKVTANGKTAFLSGDINNYDGTETALSEQLGHIDLYTVAHHGYYGSNTYSYLRSLNPSIMVLAGNYNGVSNRSTQNSEVGTLDTFMELGTRGTRLYATACYHEDLPALVFNFDENLTSNLPENSSYIASAERVIPNECIYYVNGLPTKHTGWVSSNGYTCYFDHSCYAAKKRWFKDSSNRWSYVDENGKMAVGWASANGKWYYFNQSGYMLTSSWLEDNGSTYYLNSEGNYLTGEQKIDGKWYYFKSNGAMVTSAWANGSYYGENGVWVPSYQNTRWRHTKNGWQYVYPDGSNAADTWEYIDSSWYYFRSDGYMATGWLQLDNSWYYLNSSGARQTGWVKSGNTWYYMKNDGTMATGWQTVKGRKYYMNPGSGAMYANGWRWIDKKCYYFYSSGSMAANTWIGSYYVDDSGVWIPNYQPARWIKSGSRWWYRHSDGSYTRSNWEYIGGSYYYFDSSGWMKTGWLKLNTTWYYLQPGGARLGKGWHWINGKCYYFYESGAMAADTRIDGYYVDKNGYWIKGR